MGPRQTPRPDGVRVARFRLSDAADSDRDRVLVQQPGRPVQLHLVQLHPEQLEELGRRPGASQRDGPLARDRVAREHCRDSARHVDCARSGALRLPRARRDELPHLPTTLDPGDRPRRLAADALPEPLDRVRVLDDHHRPRHVLHQLRRRDGQSPVDRVRPPPRGGGDGPRRERVGHLPEGDTAADRPGDPRGAPTLLRDLDRRLRRHLLRRRFAYDIPPLRLGSSARRRAATGKRDRHVHLCRRRDRDGLERSRSDAPRTSSRDRVNVPSVAPRLPPWWLDEAGPQTAAPRLDGDTAADVCIVGGGYTGLWTALALKERDPSLHLALVESEICGAGPSGRNGGFLHGYWAGLADLLPLLGRERALQLASAGDWIVPAVRAFCESRGEDVWLRESGMLMVSASPLQDDAVDRAVAAAAEVAAGEQAVALDANGVAERIRSPVFRRGVYFPEGATVQPARLVHALRRAVIDAGVQLYEHTPALRIGDGRIKMPCGSVRAPEIVVAINA